VNPFPGKPLTITSAKLSNAPKGVTVTYTESSISVSADSGADIGVASVTYQVQDATKDPKRVATGQYNVTVHDVPDKPAAPANVKAGDGTASMTIAAPRDNGKPIDNYKISWNGGSTTQKTIGAVNVSGLTNGTAYTFTVMAHNADGWGVNSAASMSVTPYGTPQTPSGLKASKNSDYAPSTLHVTWTKLSGADETGGGAVTYFVKVDGGGWVNAGSDNSFTTGQVGVGDHTVSLKAQNNGSGKYSGVTSDGVNVPKKPDPQPSVSLSKGDGPVYSSTCKSGCFYFNVSIKDFSAGSHTVKYYCNGWASYTDSISANGSGSGSMTSKTQSQFNCGYDGAYATVDGHKSNTVDFRNR
jgi:hypothetical protein